MRSDDGMRLTALRPAGDADWTENLGDSSMREPDCVGAIIRNGEGRVFVQRRSGTRRVLPEIWDIVGGHIEGGVR